MRIRVFSCTLFVAKRKSNTFTLFFRRLYPNNPENVVSSEEEEVILKEMLSAQNQKNKILKKQLDVTSIPFNRIKSFSSRIMKILYSHFSKDKCTDAQNNSESSSEQTKRS